MSLLPARVRRAPVAILSVLAVLATGLMAAAPAQAVPGAGSSVFINEIHYDNASTDTGEAVEIAAPAGTDLSAWKVVGYSGNTPTAATTYSEKTSLGTAPDSGNGWGFVLVAFAGLQNGGNDGVALGRVPRICGAGFGRSGSCMIVMTSLMSSSHCWSRCCPTAHLAGAGGGWITGR